MIAMLSTPLQHYPGFFSSRLRSIGMMTMTYSYYICNNRTFWMCGDVHIIRIQGQRSQNKTYGANSLVWFRNAFAAEFAKDRLPRGSDELTIYPRSQPSL